MSEDDLDDGPGVLPLDEMNLVETPFALLSRSNKNVVRHRLDGAGDRFLAASAGSLLPTALATQAVLGLLWLHRETNRFKTREIRFSLRDLVQDYMFRGVYKRPPGQLLSAVKEQLHRVANTRIYTKTWFDRRLGKRTEMDASVIDYIQVIEEGGRNRKKILEVCWGVKFHESLINNYTKPLDPTILLRVRAPIDLALYRWLDRQLSTKEEQRVASIQAFARGKLAMSGKILDKGGRSASSYIAKALSASIQRLAGLGFGVLMEIDMAKSDFSILFRRLPEGHNQVELQDLPGQLLRHFTEVHHGTSRRTSFQDADRAAAKAWLQAYGLETSKWMVQKAEALRKAYGRQPVLTFRGLQIYEDACAGAHQKLLAQQDGQTELCLEAPPERPSWRAYASVFCEEKEPSVELLEEVEHELAKQALWKVLSEERRVALVRAEIFATLTQAQGLLSQEEYEALRHPKELDSVLRQRHNLTLTRLLELAQETPSNECAPI